MPTSAAPLSEALVGSLRVKRVNTTLPFLPPSRGNLLTGLSSAHGWPLVLIAMVTVLL
jgi:hypothetical protein